MADGDYERGEARKEAIKRMERLMASWKKAKSEAAGRDSSDS